MSDSIEKSAGSVSVSPLLVPYVSAVEKAQKQLVLATKIAQELESKPIKPKVMGLGGYCAQAYVVLDAVPTAAATPEEGYRRLLEVLKAYPPVELAEVVGANTVKPTSHLRDVDNQFDTVPCFPLLSKTGVAETLRWWTPLGGGLAEVHLPRPGSCVLRPLYEVGYPQPDPRGAVGVSRRKLKDYSQEAMFSEEFSAHRQWESVFADYYGHRADVRQWAQGLYLFVYKRFVPSEKEPREQAMSFNRNGTRPAELTDTEAKRILEAVLARVDAEKREEQVLLRMMGGRLRGATELLAKVLGEAKARQGYQNGSFPSSLVAEVLQQKVQRYFGGVCLSFLREEAGFFVGRLVVQSPVFEGSVGFLDFKVKGNPEGDLLTVQRLKPEYVAVAYPWD